jgi:hypothetical protein
MTQTILKRQFITDAEGKPIAVILPMEEFVLVRDVLDQKTQAIDETDKLAKMKQAAQDPLFMTDLHETMAVFSEADADM